MNSEPKAEKQAIAAPRISEKHTVRLKVLGAAFTLLGSGLFAYFIYSVGFYDILYSIEKFGVIGFAVILGAHFLRISVRAWAWKLSVFEPYELGMKDTIPAVIIGEALSSMIPLGILVSGTSKAVAVRKRIPLVVGFSSVATENLFYSIVTSVFLILGAYTFVRSFNLEEGWILTIDVLILVIFLVLLFIITLIVRQWHFASETCEWIYQRGFLKGILEHGRMQVRLFENFIYGFYREYPERFLPICLLEAAYHAVGIFEAWFILNRISEVMPTLVSAFLLESVSRLVAIVFKLVPFLIGVDEAGARFVAETIAAGAGIGVSLAIIRKGRIIFWTAVGVLLIIGRGLSLRHFFEHHEH